MANVELPRHVFVLTDGRISDPKGTCEFISGFSHQTWLHAFGFGLGVDRYLVKEMAKNGKGKCFILEDTSASNVNTKVIEALKIATKPALTNLRTKWTLEVQFENPRPPYVENIFSGETFISTAVLKRSDLVGKVGEVSIQLFNTLDDQSNEHSVSLDLSTA